MNLTLTNPIAYERSLFVPAAVVFLILALTTVICSSVILVLMIYNWNRRCRSIVNLLSCNTCTILLFNSIVVFMEIPLLFNLPADPISCRIRGYLYLCSCAALMNSYLIQAISRYLIIIHHRRKEFSSFRFNSIMIIIGWLVSLMGPLLLFSIPDAYQFEPESHLCLMTSKVFATSFTAMIFFFMAPSAAIVLLYLSILCHTTWLNMNHISRVRIKRNMKVYQNILIHLTHIVLGGTPYLLLVIINAFLDPPRIYYLLSILCLAATFCSESLTMFYTNHDLKRIVLENIRHNRIQDVTVIPGPPNIELKCKGNENNLHLAPIGS